MRTEKNDQGATYTSFVDEVSISDRLEECATLRIINLLTGDLWKNSLRHLSEALQTYNTE